MQHGGGTGGLGADAGGEVMLGTLRPWRLRCDPGVGVPRLLCPMLGAWRQQRNHSSTAGGAAAGEGCPAAEPPAVRLKASVSP